MSLGNMSLGPIDFHSQELAKWSTHSILKASDMASICEVEAPMTRSFTLNSKMMLNMNIEKYVDVIHKVFL